VSVDALRADRLGAYGDASARMPAVDGLAARGVLFEEGIAAATWTQPSVAAMLTGRWPAALSASQKGETTQSLHAQETTLAESLAAAGYATAAFVDNGTLAPEFGYAQGFGTYVNVSADDGEAITRPAIDWLRRRPPKPFFLWIHWLDPHEPYVRRDHPPYAATDDPRRATKDVMELPFYFSDNVQRDLNTHYASEVAFVDQCLAMVLAALDELGARESTLVVFTADHGEALGESDAGKPRFGHGEPPYEEQVRIPLIVSWPGVVPAGKRVTGQRSNVDIAPTIRAFARAGSIAGDGGASLVRAILGDGGPGEDVTYSQSFQRLEDTGYPIHFAARTADYKLFMRVNRVVPEQFARDARGSYEFARRSAIPAAEFDRLEAALKKYVGLWESGPKNISEDLRQRLIGMGYLGGGTSR
jgi:arylsulfatase A-like enzyme